MEKYNILHIARQFQPNSDTSVVESDVTYSTDWGVCMQKEIENYCANFYTMDYVDLYLEKGKSGFENYVTDFVIEKKIDYVLFSPLSPDPTVDPIFLEKLHSLTTLIMLFTDSEYYFEKIHRYYAQLSDLVMHVGNFNTLSWYKLLDIKVMHFNDYFNTVCYKGGEPRNPDIEVSFVGNIGQANRRQYLDFLGQEGLDPEVYGLGTKNGVVSFDKMVDVWHRSKINLHFTSLSSPNSFILNHSLINQRIKQYKGRILEVPLSGGFLLTEYMPDLDRFLKVGEECAVFYSKEDLLEKIKYYLEHDEERERIAKNGYERGMRDYDFRSGVGRLFEILRDIKKSKATLYLDDDFIELYVSRRLYYVPYFLANAKFGNMMEEIKIIFSNFRCLSLKKAFLYFIAGITEKVLGEKIRRPFRKLKFYRYLRKVPRY
tara:strand:- start:1424 stop:2713 length:1290 start_codon:yes stop_codon:yes gene_type:complete